MSIVPETSKQGTCSSGQLTNLAHVSSPFVMAVECTAIRCSVSRTDGGGKGAECVRERVAVLVLKRIAVWEVGRLGVDIMGSGGLMGRFWCSLYKLGVCYFVIFCCEVG